MRITRRRRSSARGRGAGRRRARRSACGIAASRASSSSHGAERERRSRATRAGRRAPAPGRSTPSRWRCRRPRSSRRRRRRSSAGTPSANVAAHVGGERLRARLRRGRIVVEVALAHGARRRPAWRRGSRRRAPRPTMNSVEPPPMSSTTIGPRRPPGRAALRRAEEREPRLLLAGDRARVEPVVVAHALGELRRRSRRRASRSSAPRCARSAPRLRRSPSRYSSSAAKHARHRPRPTAARTLDAVAEPGDRAAALELVEGAARASTSATSRRVEFVPMSTTATRTARG